MYLLIDQGNSRCKYLLTCELGTLSADCQRGVWDNAEFDDKRWRERLSTLPEVEQVLISSVASQERKDWFKSLCQELLGITPQFALAGESYAASFGQSLRNCYATPEALGVDRWLAMVATFERTQGDCVVIDAGTAITLDMIDATGQHQGGHIVPGGRMLQQSLMGETGGIAWSAEHDVDLKGAGLGQNTTSAINYGAETMVKGYLRQLIEELLPQHGTMPSTILLTGGDGEKLALWLQPMLEQGRLKVTVELCPDLVLEGLSYWFSLNN